MALLRKLFGTSAKAGAAAVAGSPASASVANGMDATIAGVPTTSGALGAKGDLAAALRVVADALDSAPRNPDLLFARASLLFDWERYREARDGLLRAQGAGMQGAAFELALARTHHHLGDLQAAERSMRRALELEPGSRPARAGLATILFALRCFGDAEAAVQRLLDLSPGDVECLWMLGNCRMGQRDPAGAEGYFRQAIAADPERSVVWKDLGAALDAQDRRGEAIEASANAVRLDSTRGEKSDCFVNLAVELAYEGRTADALALHEKMLPQRPFVYGHLAYAQALLQAGRLREGWNQYEFRFLVAPMLGGRQEFGLPTWAGQDLRGKTILLLAEQGLGDTIQFIRYAPQLKAMGANVLLRVPEGFESFAQGFPGVDRVLARGATRAEFDYYLNVISLPNALGIDLASVPATVSYLHADSLHAERWSNRISSHKGLKVGLVWAGNPNHARDRQRSMSLAEFAPLGAFAGTQFFALQKGEREAEANSPPPGLSLVNLGADLKDFHDTAAVISQLDVVLSVDTAVAHLAGALGRPVWLMLPRAGEWRWLEGRDDSPWYPTMRLFRQSREGEWGDVIEQVRMALLERMHGNEGTATKTTAATSSASEPPASATSIAPALPGLGLSAVAATRYGILQYLPHEPLVGESLRWYGELLQPQLERVAQLVRPSATVVEVGSGAGAHAIFLASAIGAEGHILLYEARPVLRTILRQNLAAHQVRNVTLMRRAMAGWGSPDATGFAESSTGREATPAATTETLDDLCLEHLDLIKVNAGGVVMNVLVGASATLWRLRPSLFVAMNDDASMAEAAEFLREFGYRCWRMETAWFNPGNFNRRDNDVFAGRVALALVAIPEESEVSVAQNGWVELS